MPDLQEEHVVQQEVPAAETTTRRHTAETAAVGVLL
jgi:hypothetical protein